MKDTSNKIVILCTLTKLLSGNSKRIKVHPKLNEITDIITREIPGEIVTYLGAGAMGAAFLTSTGQVFKITTDMEEVAVANLLKDANHSNLVKFPLAKAIDIGKGEMIGYIVRGSVAKVIEDVDEHLAYLLDSCQNAMFDLDISFNCIKTMLADDEMDISSVNRQVLEQYANGMEYLLSLGLTHADIHSGNVGLDDAGIVKIFDIGLTRRKIPKDAVISLKGIPTLRL